MEDMYNRKTAVKALVGSHNYNLNTENSDKDYKYFVFPTFDDLYSGKMFSTAVQTEVLDYDCHDVRQLGNLIWKANLNFIEVLFSCELKFDARLTPVFVGADVFASMNLFAFYNATYGMHLMKIKDLYKGTAKTAELVAKFGYDTKQACHALRCLYVLDRVASGMSMREALWFADDSTERYNLLTVKAGQYNEEAFFEMVNLWHDTKKAQVKEYFSKCQANEGARDILDTIIKDAIRQELS